MKSDLSTRLVAGSFLAAALMLWGGWALLPHHIGTYFNPDDFARVNEHWTLWIWMFRFHLFGMIFTVIALLALASQVTQHPSRVLIWPGAAVAASGLIVGALGAAFYYHHGAWGARELDGKTPEEIQAFVDALRIDTEYVTCLVRFSRVFTGLGLVLIGLAMLLPQLNPGPRLLPAWVSGVAVALGLAAMALTMGLPDELALYQPVFHVQCLWLAATGVVIWRLGLCDRTE